MIQVDLTRAGRTRECRHNYLGNRLHRSAPLQSLPTVLRLVRWILGALTAGALCLALLSTLDGLLQISCYKTQTAEVQIKILADAIALYRIKFGHYPTLEQGLSALAHPPEGKNPLIGDVPRDPWNHEYAYWLTSSEGTQRFDVASTGPDGIEGTDDDIRLVAFPDRRP